MEDTLKLEDVLEEIFTSETPHDVIYANQELLNNAISKSLGDELKEDWFKRQQSDLRPNDQHLVADVVERDGGSSDAAANVLMNFMREQAND